MVKRVLVLIGIICSFYLNAQTGIGTTTPNVSAKLDVYSDNKGFLPPRVTLTSASDNSTIASPAEGLLVYNKGSVGLQAGYYYWNGANWATIATATSAGNGVTATDMVKLYQETYSTTAGKASSSSGYSFTVPVSGRYEFNFNCTGWNSNGSLVKLTFNIREGTNVIGTDYHQSASSNAWVEYEGRFEVNLIAGVTYNAQVVTTTGSRSAGYDWDKIMYKMVAGNLPITGQTVDYVSVSRTGSDQTVNTNSTIVFNTINGGNIPYNTSNGLFSLTAGKTYKLIGGVSLSNGNTVAKEVNIVWKNAAGEVLGTKGELLSPSAAVDASGNGIAYAIYTPSSNTTVSLNVNYSSTNTILWQNFTFASIEQIGSSAIVNPWVLSGNDSYNTTGNIGIGTNTPTSKLNIAGGGIKLASGLGNASTRPTLNTATIGNYEIRGVGGGSPQLDTQDDGFLRLSAGGGTNTNTQSSIDISGYSTIPDMSNNIVMRTGGIERLRIDPSGNLNVTGKINVGDATGNVVTKVSGRVTAGNFITMDNLKFTVTTSGNRSLAVATVSGTANLYVQGIYVNGSGSMSGSRTGSPITYTTTLSGPMFNWHFGVSGDSIIYHFNDADNGRMYRVTLIIMPSYIDNFITIERLL
jgi:hypothetical protein